jgi:peptide/nickel transport system permease protein
MAMYHRARAGLARFQELSPTGRLALLALLALALAALVGPGLWGQGALDQHVELRLGNPSLAHPLGTDSFGRDIFARLLMGARWSLVGAATVCLGTSALGFALGTLAAFGNRAIDATIGRLIEALLALPGLVAALALTAVLGPSFPDLLLALIVTSWPSSARIFRALILRERQAGYVEGAVALGASRWRVVLRHILPNIFGPALVLATANFGGVILGLASLSFLGLGMQPPTPEWGRMINDARPYFQRYPWQMVAPGLCIALTVLAVNLSADALRDRIAGQRQRSTAGRSGKRRDGTQRREGASALVRSGHARFRRGAQQAARSESIPGTRV